MVEESLVLSQDWFKLSEEECIIKEDGEMEARISHFLPLTVRAVGSWVEINHRVTVVKAPPMVKHKEGEISKAPFSELYPSWILKQWENSLQYLYFQHLSRSILDIGECLQACCLQ